MAQKDEKMNKFVAHTRKMTGYLERRGKVGPVGHWKKWWCVLEGQLLLYYKSQMEYLKLSPCCGSLNIGLVRGIQPHISCQIHVATHSKLVIFRTMNKADHQEWFRALVESMPQNHKYACILELKLPEYVTLKVSLLNDNFDNSKVANVEKNDQPLKLLNSTKTANKRCSCLLDTNQNEIYLNSHRSLSDTNIADICEISENNNYEPNFNMNRSYSDEGLPSDFQISSFEKNKFDLTKLEVSIVSDYEYTLKSNPKNVKTTTILEDKFYSRETGRSSHSVEYTENSSSSNRSLRGLSYSTNIEKLSVIKKHNTVPFKQKTVGVVGSEEFLKRKNITTDSIISNIVTLEKNVSGSGTRRALKKNKSFLHSNKTDFLKATNLQKNNGCNKSFGFNCRLNRQIIHSTVDNAEFGFATNKAHSSITNVETNRSKIPKEKLNGRQYGSNCFPEKDDLQFCLDEPISNHFISKIDLDLCKFFENYTKNYAQRDKINESNCESADHVNYERESEEERCYYGSSERSTLGEKSSGSGTRSTKVFCTGGDERTVNHGTSSNSESVYAQRDNINTAQEECNTERRKSLSDDHINKITIRHKTYVRRRHSFHILFDTYSYVYRLNQDRTCATTEVKDVAEDGYILESILGKIEKYQDKCNMRNQPTKSDQFCKWSADLLKKFVPKRKQWDKENSRKGPPRDLAQMEEVYKRSNLFKSSNKCEKLDIRDENLYEICNRIEYDAVESHACTSIEQAVLGNVSPRCSKELDNLLPSELEKNGLEFHEKTEMVNVVLQTPVLDVDILEENGCSLPRILSCIEKKPVQKPEKSLSTEYLPRNKTPSVLESVSFSELHCLDCKTLDTPPALPIKEKCRTSENAINGINGDKRISQNGSTNLDMLLFQLIYMNENLNDTDDIPNEIEQTESDYDTPRPHHSVTRSLSVEEDSLNEDVFTTETNDGFKLGETVHCLQSSNMTPDSLEIPWALRDGLSGVTRWTTKAGLNSLSNDDLEPSNSQYPDSLNSTPFLSTGAD